MSVFLMPGTVEKSTAITAPNANVIEDLRMRTASRGLKLVTKWLQWIMENYYSGAATEGFMQKGLCLRCRAGQNSGAVGSNLILC